MVRNFPFPDDMKIMSLEGDELMTFLPYNCFLEPHSMWMFIKGLASNLIFYVGGFTNVSESNQMKVTKSCSLFPLNYIIKALNLTMTTSIDIFLVGVMLTTSAYMVLILFRHHRQHKYLHSHMRSSPEKKATQTILLLVTFFVVMYWVDFIISSTAVLLWMYNPVIHSVQILVLNVYPTVTPLSLILSGCLSKARPGGFTNVSETNQMKVTKSCSIIPPNYIIRALNLTVTTSIDVFLVGVMLTTSSYIVLILFRHQKQHKYLHRLSHLRSSPEKKATQTILLLVTFFVVMYWVDFIISSTAVLLWMYNPVIQSVQKLVMNVYPTITPLVQISYDNRIINILKNIRSKYH
ncbi:hypothetical protein ACRRTK_005421 [Alexandromys fortis]